MNKRKIVFRRMLESIACMRNKIQFMVIPDDKEIGHKYVSRLLINKREEAIGKYIWFLDDDDVCTCPQLPEIVLRIDACLSPDLIMTRSMIFHHGIFPLDIYWKKDIGIYPIKAVSIMTPIVKRDIFIKAITNIEGHTHQVDTHYFIGIQAIHRLQPLKTYYLDYVIGWQPIKLSTNSEISLSKIDNYVQFGVKPN